MNNNIYLDFFYKLIKEEVLFEKTTIKKFLKDSIIPEKESYKKELSWEFFICEVLLENKKILLLEDFPINFLISQTLLIGDKCKIFEFEIEEKQNKIFVCEERLLEKIKENFNIKNLNEIRPRDLHNKKYFFNFEQPKFIKDLKNYIGNVKKLDFKRTHMIESNRIENFIPNAKHSHFRLASKMSIPLVPLIKNNYVKDSIINIYDTKKIKDITKPLLFYKKKVFCNVLKKNNLRLYNDVDGQFFIKIKNEEIIEQILSCKKTNFNKEDVTVQIKNIDSVKISSNYGRYPLPLWKSVLEQKFVEIKDEESFKDMSGVSFKLDPSLFEKLFLQTLSGEEAFYKNKFLDAKINSTIEKLEEKNKIEFNTINDLIIQLMYNKENNIQEIIINENICENKIIQLRKKLKQILEKIIQVSIENNHKPEYIRPQDNIAKYYASISRHMSNIYDMYQEDLKKKDLLNESLKKIEKVLECIKYQKINDNQTYLISEILLKSLKILKVFDNNNSAEIEKLFKSYFKDFKMIERGNKRDLIIENFVEDSILAKKISKKKKIKILIKKDFDKTIFEKIEIINDEPSYTKYIKPNVRKLKEIFRYNSHDAIIQIEKMSPEKIHYSKIKIKDKYLDVKNNFYFIFKKYGGHRQILENEWFKLLIEE